MIDEIDKTNELMRIEKLEKVLRLCREVLAASKLHVPHAPMRNGMTLRESVSEAIFKADMALER